VQEAERGAADPFDAEGRDAKRAYRIPDGHDFDPDALRVLQEPTLFQRYILQYALLFLFTQLPDRSRVGSLVAFVELGNAERRAGLQQAVLRDEPGKAARCVRTATETENVNVVADFVVADEPLVRFLHVFVQALAEHATHDAVHPDVVIDQLRRALGGLRRAQRLHPPYVRVAFDGVPRAVQKDSQILLPF
jgi:hypothetical protein